MRKGGLVSQGEPDGKVPLSKFLKSTLSILAENCVFNSFTQVRVYDSVLVEELNYKAILISEETTVEDVIRSIPHFYLDLSSLLSVIRGLLIYFGNACVVM